MRLNRDLTYLPTSRLVIHEYHPVMYLHSEIRLRLLNVYSENGELRVSRSAVLDRLELNPIHIAGSHNKPKVIAGWSYLLAAKLVNIDEVPCIHDGKMGDKSLERIIMNDLLLGLSFQRTDVIAQRIRSIVLNKHLEKQSVKSLLTMDFKSLRDFFEIPVVRRRSALVKLLQKSNEHDVVTEFILSDFDARSKSIKAPETNVFDSDTLF